MSGDAADETVRIMLNGTEVAVRLAGTGVKSLAELLIAWSREDLKTYGKTSMARLLRTGDELQVISMDEKQYGQFKELARGKVLYAPFVNAKADDGKVDVVVSSKSVPMVSFILRKIGYGDEVRTEADPSKKNSTPWRTGLSGPTTRSTREPGGPGRDSPKLESVVVRLEENRRSLEQRSRRAGERARPAREGRSR